VQIYQVRNSTYLGSAAPPSRLLAQPCGMPLPRMQSTLGAVFLALATALPQHDNNWDSCTSIAVSRGASADGETSMVSHSNDCADCDFRVAYVPARRHPPGTMRAIVEGSGARQASAFPRYVDAGISEQYAPTAAYPAGAVVKPVIGHIPEVESTYARWDGTYGFINEKGLAIGESTCSGYLVAFGPRDGGNALLVIRDLIALALERCATARCGIQTMGELAEKHGFYGEDPGQGGAGEAATLTDPTTGEAWVFHVMADNATNAGAVWAAQRVPEGHVAVVANNFIIKEIDFEDAEGTNYMWSANILDVARKAGVYDGSEPFNWQRHMAPDIRTFSYFPGSPPIPMYTALRMWVVQTTIQPSMRELENFRDGEVTSNVGLLPFSVKAEVPVTKEMVMGLHRNHYENTRYDMRRGILAAPFGNPNRLEGGLGIKKIEGEFARAISIQRTTYAQVGVARKADSHGFDASVMWLAIDAPATSVYVPFYRGTLEGSHRGHFAVAEYGTGNRYEFDMRSPPTAAWWAFDLVNNYMDRHYQNMSEEVVYPAMRTLQASVLREADRLELDASAEFAVAPAKEAADAASKMLGEGQTALQRHVTSTWWALAGNLIVTYNDGYFNWPSSAPSEVASLGYPADFLEMIGYDHSFILPQYPFRKKSHPGCAAEAELATVADYAPWAANSVVWGVSTTVCLLVGYAVGRRHSRAAAQEAAPYMPL